MDNKDKEKFLEECNNRSKAFKENQEKQLERDQVVMPIEDLPIDEIKYEREEERNKKELNNVPPAKDFKEKTSQSKAGFFFKKSCCKSPQLAAIFSGGRM
ncbi:hypothetical protein P4534_04170 [Peribacillus butanolivorans]|uniref:hypothetical protein n=1 Tax=Peribacillus butanolivorans TaxID=421767 RepID=UPI002E1E8522|nr:hypothetical protein [Peribacillus butanolivorans]